MKLSEQWLKEWVNPQTITSQWLEQLTSIGHEVEDYLPVAGEFSGVVVGQVKSLAKHPNAERLHVCKVDVGLPDRLNIVCGGTNLELDMKVAVSMVGAELPGGFKIQATQLRGEPSEGMICASPELGMGDSPKGHVMRLAADAKVGIPLAEYLDLNDNQIELAITPNRGDCLSIQGIAREIAALSQVAINEIIMTPVNAVTDNQVSITLQANEACPRYLGRVITNVNLEAPTPVWLSERLRRCGMRSIDPIVDVTNYVMLELGQPMHAFDYDKLKYGITVRMATSEERLTLLDGTELNLEPSDLVIADDEKAIALAGVMGGEYSSVSGTTQNILLESAYFNPETIAKTLRRTGLLSESAHRFERGVDFELQRKAIERATALLIDIAHGEPGPVIEAVETKQLPTRPPITLREARLAQVLGITIEASHVSNIFKNLNLKVERVADGWHVNPPSYRHDLQLEIDLIEEVARMHGLAQIPATPMPLTMGGVSQLPKTLKKPEILTSLQQTLCQRGYHQVINYSFVSPQWQKQLLPEGQALALTNPISSELAEMRLSLWPGLLNTVHYNQNRQHSRMRLFEHGLRFIPEGNSYRQERVLAGVSVGTTMPEQWGTATSAVDFYDIKADVLALFDRQAIYLNFEPCEHPSLHPSQSACIKHEGKVLGYLGMIHPAVKQQLKLEGAIALFEIPFASFMDQSVTVFQPLAKFPSVRRDIAMIIDEAISAQQLLNTVRSLAKGWHVDSFVFDVYQGEGIAVGKKSMALGLILQDSSRTLQDDEVEALINQIIQQLSKEYQAELRR